VAQVICSEQAERSVENLPLESRDALEQRLDYLTGLPRMYPITQDERFPGCRTFWIQPCYRVFYMVAAGGDDVYVVAVVEEEIDRPGEDY
jgi:hypothetical protein